MPSASVYLRAVFTEIRTFNVTVDVNIPQAGIASASPNSGFFGNSGERVSLTAQANHGFEFSHWEVAYGSVGIINATTHQASFIMPASDVHVIAVFEERMQVTITATSNNYSWGTAWASQSQTTGNDIATALTAQANPGFRFSHWEMVGGTTHFVGWEFHFNANISVNPSQSNVVFTAIFVEE